MCRAGMILFLNVDISAASTGLFAVRRKEEFMIQRCDDKCLNAVCTCSVYIQCVHLRH